MVNWHHEVMGEALMEVLRGECKRLMIFMPPRMGKSEMVSRRFPAFAFGQDPTRNIIVSSYSADLANSMNLDVQRIMLDQSYLDLFPNVRLDANKLIPGNFKQRENFFDIAMKDGGGYKSSGIGGPLTGFGFDIGIIDDFIKNRKDAESATYRDALFNWYTSTFYTRRNSDDAAIILTVTRWHEADLAGRLLELQESDPDADQWKVIEFPAIREMNHDSPHDPREVGEALWPYRYNLEALNKIRINSGPRDWSSLHQQSPFTAGGGIVKSEWWKMYDQRDLPRFFDTLIQSWDFTFKKKEDSDFVVGQVWGKKGSDIFLLDQLRRRMGFVESRQAMIDMSRKWPKAMTKLVEDKANGTAIIDTLKNSMLGILPINPTESKEARAHACSGIIEAGNVHLPRTADFTPGFIKEWTSFPNGTNDDQVDASTQALNYMNNDAVSRLLKLTSK